MLLDLCDQSRHDEVRVVCSPKSDVPMIEMEYAVACLVEKLVYVEVQCALGSAWHSCL